MFVFFDLRGPDGEWDDFLESLFAKKATVIVRHASDREKDIRLPMGEGGRHGVGSQGPDDGDSILYSEKVSWQDIETNGFVVNDALHANIEFE